MSVFQVKLDPSCVTFTRWLVDDFAKCLENILSEVNAIHLTDQSDIVTWRFNCNGLFNVKSTYRAVTSNETGPYHKKTWKGKSPPKSRSFYGLL